MGGAIRSTIRCCISCILPCGSLDVVRIVHSNGHVEEISGTITAAEVMKLHPKHVLKKSSSSPSTEDDGVPKIVVVPPEAELQRGKIYFLIPAPSMLPHKKTRSRGSRRKKRESSSEASDRQHQDGGGGGGGAVLVSDFLVSDRYLSEILSEKVSTQRDRRRGRVGVWRPHLESISETLVD